MQVSDSKINALLTLLGDEDPGIRQVAKKELRQYGDNIVPLIHEIAKTDTAGLLRIEAQILLEENRLQKLADSFRNLNEFDDLDLEQASFILAQIEYPDLDIPHYTRSIDRLAEEVDRFISPAKNKHEKILRLRQFLHEVEGFKGNSDAYYDPENSYINRVLDRHLGIPISLSSIYLFIAKRLNLPIEGVGFPGHFLLKYDVESDIQFIDAFNSGQILSREDCKTFLAKLGYPFYDSYLCPATPRDILSRIIRNLVLIYTENNQQRKIEILERIFSSFIMA